jgi:ABC-type multidrug transport system fused ATPase/permease subunit
MATTIQLCTTVVGGLAVGFWKGYHIALVVIGLGPLVGGIMAMMSKIISEGAQMVKDAYLVAGSSAEEQLRAVKTVTSFNGQLSGLRKYSEGLDEASKAGKKLTLWTGIAIGGMQGSFNLMYAVALWFGLWLVREEKVNDLTGEVYTGGDVLASFFGVVIAAMTAGQLGPDYMEVVKARAAVFRLLQIVDRPSSMPLSDAQAPSAKLTGDVVFKDVSFAYPMRPKVTVLADFSVQVKAGSTVAFVGASGSGKSTVVKLVDRVYDALQGSVTIGGVDVKQMDVRWLRSQVAMVNQEPVLMSGTFEENIRLGIGLDNAACTHEDVVAAAKIARAHDFIMEAGGYNASIGVGGGQLSGGQKQRIGIARVVIMNPTILLLDEATSALDYHSEKLVAEALAELMKGKTTLIVAHRLSTVKDADEIYVMKEGEIIQQGTYASMLEQEDSAFAELVKKQLLGEKKDTSGSDSDSNAEGDDVAAAQMASTRQKRQSSAAAKPTEKKNDAKDVDEGEKEKEEEADPPGRMLELLSTMSTFEKWLLIPMTIFSIMGASLQPGFAVAFGEMIKLFYLEDDDEMEEGAWIWSGAFVGMAIVVTVGEVGKALIAAEIGENLVRKLRRSLFLSIMRKDMSFFEQEQMTVSVIAGRMGQEADLCKKGTIGVVGDAIGVITVIVTALTIAFITSWKLTLALLGTVPFMIGARYVYEFICVCVR